MSAYTLENYEDKLIHQLIHLDQGLWYCPEYRANKAVRYYPSRMLQLAWSVYKGYIKPSPYVEETLFTSILSRQGERWQVFGEDPEDITDCVILCREMMRKKGFGMQYGAALQDLLAKNDGHIIPCNGDVLKKWRDNIPTDSSSKTYLLLDDATAVFAADFAPALGNYFKRRGECFSPPVEPVFAGFEYFAYGMIDEGKAHVQKFIAGLSEQGIKTILTLSGQTEYLFKVLLPKIGIAHEFEVKNILDDCTPFAIPFPAYIHGGSFNLRYLAKGPALEKLTPNLQERAVKNAPEFSPLVEGARRVNPLTIWEKPLCAEYTLVLPNEDQGDKIFEDALRGIQRSGCAGVVCFEPYSYKILKERTAGVTVSYYMEML